MTSACIITMLPSSPQVKAVYSGSILPTLHKLHTDPSEHTFCIDSTTLDVTVAREIAADIMSAGARMIDAPVSGGKFFASLDITKSYHLHVGVTGAKAGTLSFLVGGTVEDFNTASPILAFMGQKIIHCGPSGAGLGAKICNNVGFSLTSLAWYSGSESAITTPYLACFGGRADRSRRSHAFGTVPRAGSCCSCIRY